MLGRLPCVACRAPYRSPSHNIPKPYICTVRQSVSQVGQYIRVCMGRPGWQGRLCVGSFLSRVCSGITQRARAAAAPALALAPFLGSLVVVGCGAGCRRRCRCRLLAGLAGGCHARGRIRTAHLLELVSHNTSTLPSPPFRHAAEIRGKGLRSTFGVLSPSLPANPAGQAQPSFGPSPFCLRREARG